MTDPRDARIAELEAQLIEQGNRLDKIHGIAQNVEWGSIRSADKALEEIIGICKSLVVETSALNSGEPK